MKVTYQHRVIASHLHEAYGHISGWPFMSPHEIEEELSRREVHLVVGDYLVIDTEGGAIGLGKALGLQDLSAHGKQALIIPYFELERAFHDQYSEWVEL
jgi:hypothetical protein